MNFNGVHMILNGMSLYESKWDLYDFESDELIYIYTYICTYIYIYMVTPPPMDPPRALIFAKVPQIPIKPMLSGDFPVTGFLTVFLNSLSLTHTHTEGFSFCWLLFII